MRGVPSDLRWTAWLFLLLAMPTRLEAVPNGKFLIGDGERVVFVGDSITENAPFINYMSEFLAVRWPEWEVELVDRGVFGHRAVDALARLKQDIIPLRADLVVLFFGVNDGRYQSFRPEFFNSFVHALRQMTLQLQAAGSRVALVTPTVIDPDEIKGYPGNAADYNAVLGRYAKAVLDLGRELRVPVLDVHSVLSDVQRQAKKALPRFTMIPGGVHPSAAGHLLIAARMLRDMGAAPITSVLEIDAKRGRAVVANGCQVSELKTADDVVSFSRVDQHWWWRIDPEATSVLPWASDVQDLNAVILKVSGLAPGRYRVLVDSQMIAQTFTHAQLAGGLHVARVAPAPAGLTELARLIAEHRQVSRLKWGPIAAVLPSGPEKNEVLLQIDRLLARLHAAQVAHRKPRLVRWDIIPQRDGR